MADLSGVTANFEPSIGGKLLYLPVAVVRPGFPADAGGGMVNFSLAIGYAAAPSGPASLVAKSLKVWFPDAYLPVNTYAISGTLETGKTLSIFLDDLRRIDDDKTRGRIRILTNPRPAGIRIEVEFEGYDPVVFDPPLQAHANPTPQGSYGFPFSADDLGPGEYLYVGSEHVADHSQHWGYDFNMLKRVGSKYVSSTGPKAGDYPIFGRPVRAVADGIVLTADDHWDDHDEVGLRKLYSTTLERGPVGVVSIAATFPNPSRIFTAVTDQHGQLLVLSFLPGNDSFSLGFLGKSAPGAAFTGKTLSSAALSATQLIVAGVAGDVAQVFLYSISDDGKTVTLKNSIRIPGTKSIQVSRYSVTQFIMVRQPVEGNLEVSAWKTGDTGLPAAAALKVGAGGATEVCRFAILDSTRLVTAVRTESGRLRVIAWNIAVDDKNKITSIVRGEHCDVETTVDQIAVSEEDASATLGQFMVSTRNGAGNLAVYYFQIDKDSSAMTFLAGDAGGAVGEIAQMRFKRGQSGVAAINASGEAQMIAYEYTSDDQKNWYVERSANHVEPGGRITAIDVARIVPVDGKDNIETCAVAMRTQAGNLKLILWRAPQGNGVKLLCGNEFVQYSHLKHASIPASVKAGAWVKAGDKLGEAGYSGPASGPQLHMHCERVDIDSRNLPAATKAAIENGTYVIANSSPRPLLFHGVSVLDKSLLTLDDWAKNPFVPVDDRGFYFNPIAIYPAYPGKPAK